MMQIETEAKAFYDECANVFRFKPIDAAVISTLSWDWKNPYTRR